MDKKNTQINFLALKNFKSFSDVKIDFQSTKSSTKNMAIIFGENGSGKSTIVEAIHFLHNTLFTKSNSGFLEDVLRYASEHTDEKNDRIQSLIESIDENMILSIDHLIDGVKSIASSEPMEVKLGLRIGELDGEYTMVLSDDEIIRETMIFPFEGRKSTLWDISSENIKIYEKIFTTAKYKHEMTETIKRYWGRHTFLALLTFEKQDKAAKYIRENVNPILMELCSFFHSISYSVSFWGETPNYLHSSNPLLNNLESGTLPSKFESVLDQTAHAVELFFQSIFTNVTNVYYRKNYSGNLLDYQLMLTKKEGGREFPIAIGQESSGTRDLLYLLPYIVTAMNGNIVFIDEFGASLHEQLVPALVRELNSRLRGQLILTTHHLSILDQAGLRGDTFYFITADPDEKKQILCTTDIESRLQNSYNYRNRYLTREEYGIAPRLSEETYINLDGFEE